MSPRDLGTLLALAAIWGSSFLLIRLGIDDLPPLSVVELRLALGALAAGAVALGLRTPGVGAAFRRPLVAVTGLCATGIPFTLYAYGETRVSSGVAGISNATAPLFAAVIAQAVPLGRGGERLTRERFVGLAIGFAGVCVLASDGLTGALDAVGLVVCFGAPLFYGVGGLLAKSAYRHDAPVVAAVAGNGLAALILLPLVVGAGRPGHLPGARAALAVTALGVVGTGLAFVLFYTLLRRIGSATFTVTYLMPVVAVVEGAVFLGETVRPTAAAALVAILAGTAVANGMVRLPLIARRPPGPVAAATPEDCAVERRV